MSHKTDDPEKGEPRSARDWAQEIPADMRGHVMHELGELAKEAKAGGVHTNDSGDNGPPPAPPGKPKPNN